MNAIAPQAPVFSVRAFKFSSIPLCEDAFVVFSVRAFKFSSIPLCEDAFVAPLLCDGKLYHTIESGVFEQGDLHESFVHIHVTVSGAVSICFPVSHLLTLDLSGIALNDVCGYENSFGHCDRYSIDFPSYDAALAFLALNYGVTDAPDDPTKPNRAPAPADASPCPSVIVVPAHLSTPPRLTRRPLSTTAFSPFGVMHMSKKQPIRVFLDQEIHSRYLIQAGTNGLTPSALGERLIESGLTQLERGDKAPLDAPAGDASPAPHGNGA